MSERLYLVRSDVADLVHGVDYLKGLVDEEERVVRECGRRHEFQTRQCRPVYLTGEEALRLGYPDEELVEIVPLSETLLERMAIPVAEES